MNIKCSLLLSEHFKLLHQPNLWSIIPKLGLKNKKLEPISYVGCIRNWPEILPNKNCILCVRTIIIIPNSLFTQASMIFNLRYSWSNSHLSFYIVIELIKSLSFRICFIKVLYIISQKKKGYSIVRGAIPRVMTHPWRFSYVLRSPQHLDLVCGCPLWLREKLALLITNVQCCLVPIKQLNLGFDQVS